MKKRIFSLCIVLLFLLAGCTQEPKKNPMPISSQYDNSVSSEEVTSSEEQETAQTAIANKYYEFNGGNNIFEDFMGDEEDKNSSFDINVEKNTIPATLSTKWDATNVSPIKNGGALKEAQAMREKVLNSKNTAEIYKWSGKTYYVSPDGDDKNDGLSPKTAIRTLNADAIYLSPPKPGDAILFERGGVWRMTNSIKAYEGVVYGSYGKGEKPTFVGSIKNYAKAEYWNASNKENVWKLTVADTDIGLIVFNHGEMVGWKKYNGVTTLENNGDYYYNSKDETIYLYFDKGNPGKYFKDIEIALKKHAIGISKDNVVIDNLRIKYYAHHGISMSNNKNTKITNCEIGFIGGATQTETTRLGNCIQQWNSTDKQLVENCWLYQAYDTGYTWQGRDAAGNHLDSNTTTGAGENVYYRNIDVKNNVIEYCCYAVEFWHNDNGVPCLAKVENFNIQNNVLRQNGYGWSEGQRPDKNGNAIYVNQRWFPNAKNCKIQNNILDLSKRMLVYWSFTGGPYGEWEINGNTYYQSKNVKNEGVWYGGLKETTNQSELASAVATFDNSPKLVKWLTK